MVYVGLYNYSATTFTLSVFNSCLSVEYNVQSLVSSACLPSHSIDSGSQPIVTVMMHMIDHIKLCFRSLGQPPYYLIDKEMYPMYRDDNQVGIVQCITYSVRDNKRRIKTRAKIKSCETFARQKNSKIYKRMKPRMWTFLFDALENFFSAVNDFSLIHRFNDSILCRNWDDRMIHSLKEW